MIKFNELRISEDKSYLKVNCQVENLDGYSNVYIDGIYAIKYTDFKPTASSFSDYSDTSKVVIYDGDPTKHIEIAKSSENFSGGLSGALYFILVTHTGNVSTSLLAYDCSADEQITYGVVLDWEKVYSEGMQYALQFFKNCGENCNDNRAWEDFILRWEAFKLAISTCDWVLVSELWDSLFSRTKAVASSGCGCGKFR